MQGGLFYRLRCALFPALHGGCTKQLLTIGAPFIPPFPKANPKFWNPAVSWETRQYLGYKFDAKHMLASTTQITGFGAGIVIGIGERRPFWHYVLDAGISFAAYTVGNAITYDLLYR